MIELAAVWFLLAHVCPEVQGEECRDFSYLMHNQAVCENRKSTLLDGISAIKAEDYGWPSGTKIIVNLQCAKVRRIMPV